MNDDLLDPGMGHSNTGGNQNYQQPGTLPNATATLVLGIISIVGCFAYGIPGLVCGIIALYLHKKDKELYDSNPSYYENSFKNAKAGHICAIIGTSLSAAFILFLIIYLIFVVSVVSSLPRY